MCTPAEVEAFIREGLPSPCLTALGPGGPGYVLYMALRKGIRVDVVRLARQLSWKDFEEFLRHVFREFGYHVASNIRLECVGGRAEFDLLAWDRRFVLVVEAKRWKYGGSRWPHVAEVHRSKVERCLATLLALAPAAVPLVVTATEVSLLAGGVPVVSVSKLRHFLTSFYDHLDEVAVFR